MPFHVWGSLVEKAGYKISDAPKTWDAFWDFFKPMQKKLRESMRSVYALGLQLTSTGPADGNNLFYAFVIANGGENFMSPDGKAHLDDPQVREAVIKSLTYVTTAYKDGYVPPGVLSWSDADDNNAFHAKEIVMDFDGTISTEVALYHDKEVYHDMVTMGCRTAMTASRYRRSSASAAASSRRGPRTSRRQGVPQSTRSSRRSRTPI